MGTVIPPNTNTWDKAISTEQLLTDCSAILRYTVSRLVFGPLKALFPTSFALANLISRCLHLWLCFRFDVLVFPIADFYSSNDRRRQRAVHDRHPRRPSCEPPRRRCVHPPPSSSSTRSPLGQPTHHQCRARFDPNLFLAQLLRIRLVGRRAVGIRCSTRAHCIQRANVGVGVEPLGGWGAYANGPIPECNVVLHGLCLCRSESVCFRYEYNFCCVKAVTKDCGDGALLAFYSGRKHPSSDVEIKHGFMTLSIT
jgi:hypothetical protein